MKQTLYLLILFLLVGGTLNTAKAQGIKAPSNGDQYFYWHHEQAPGFTGSYDLQVKLFSKASHQLVQTLNIPNWADQYLYVPKEFIYENYYCDLTVRSKGPQGTYLNSQNAVAMEIGDPDGSALVGQWHCVGSWTTIQLYHQLGTFYSFHLETGNIQKVVYMSGSQKSTWEAGAMASGMIEGVDYSITEIEAEVGDDYCDANGYSLTGTIYGVMADSDFGSWLGPNFMGAYSLLDQNNGFIANLVAYYGGPNLIPCADIPCAGTGSGSSDPVGDDPTDPFGWGAATEEIWDGILDCVGSTNGPWPCDGDDNNGSILDGFGDLPLQSSLQLFSHPMFNGLNLEDVVEEIAFYNLTYGPYLGNKYIYDLAQLDQYSQDMETQLNTSGMPIGIHKLHILLKNGRVLQKTFVKKANQSSGNKTDLTPSPRFEVYPNPGNGQLELQGYRVPQTELTIAVLDGMGKTVYEIKRTGLEHMSLNLETLPKGIYHLTIKGDATSWVEKIILQ